VKNQILYDHVAAKYARVKATNEGNVILVAQPYRKPMFLECRNIPSCDIQEEVLRR